MAYVVVEIQTYEGSAPATLVTTFTDRAQAESDYYRVLAAAAVSPVPKHAAALLDDTGFCLMRAGYDRTPSPSPSGGDDPV